MLTGCGAARYSGPMLLLFPLAMARDLDWEPGQQAAPLYNRAVLAFEEQRFDDVYAFLATMERRGVPCGRGLLLGAVARLREGEAAAARQALQELSMRFPDQGEVWLRLSDASFVAGAAEASVAEAEVALDRGGGAAALEAALRGLRRQGGYAEAAALIAREREEARFPAGVLACVEVPVLADQGRTAEAAAALAGCPVDQVALRLRAEVALAEVAGEPGRLRELALIAGERELAAAWEAAGLLGSDPAGCVERLAPVVASDPRDPALRLLRARCRLAAGQTGEARRDLEPVLASATAGGPAVRVRADGRLTGVLSLADARRLEEAIQAAGWLLIDLELQSGRPEEAARALARLEQAGGATPAVFAGRSRMAAATGGDPWGPLVAGLAAWPEDGLLIQAARGQLATDPAGIPAEMVARFRAQQGGGEQGDGWEDGWKDAWNLARYHLEQGSPQECLADLPLQAAAPPAALTSMRGLAYVCAARAGDIGALSSILAANGGPEGLAAPALLQHAWLLWQGDQREAAAGLTERACRGASGPLVEQCWRMKERLRP